MGSWTTAIRTWAAGETVTAANMNAQIKDFASAFGAFTSYTPTWTASGTAPAIGNGTLTGRYLRVQNLVMFTISQTMGSSTTYGTGLYSWTLPVTTSQTSPRILGGMRCDDSGSATYIRHVMLSTSTTFSALTEGAVYVGQTAPFTWGSADFLTAQGWYEV